MKKKDSSLWVFFETRIREFQINRQYATVHHYQSTKRSFQRFLGGREFFFGQLDHPTLLAYNEWLMRKGLQLNILKEVEDGGNVVCLSVRDNISFENRACVGHAHSMQPCFVFA